MTPILEVKKIRHSAHTSAVQSCPAASWRNQMPTSALDVKLTVPSPTPCVPFSESTYSNGPSGHRPKKHRGFTALRAALLGFGQVLVRTEAGARMLWYLHAWSSTVSPPSPVLLKAHICRLRCRARGKGPSP